MSRVKKRNRGIATERMAFTVIAGLMAFSLPAATGAQEDLSVDKWESDGVLLENVPRNAASEGRKVRAHLPTTNTYRFFGYSLDGEDAYFNRNGDIYRYNGGVRGAELVLDRPWSLNGATVANVCGKEGFLTQRDSNGDEYNRIYLTIPQARDRIRLTEGKARRVSLTLSGDRSQLTYASSPQGSGKWHIMTKDLCSEEKPKSIAVFNDTMRIGDWSRDGAFILATTQNDESNELITIDAGTGERRILIQSPGSISNARFAADGKKVFFITGGLSDYSALYRLDLETGRMVDISSGLKRDVDAAVLSPDRTKLALLVNWEGLNRVIILDAVALRKLDTAPKRSPGVIGNAAFSPDNRRLIMTLTQPASPSRTAVYDLEKDRLRAWSGGFSNSREVELLPKLIRYPTFDMVDGKPREIPALLYMPPDLKPGAKVPVMINAHGGPASQHRPDFNRTVHYYVTEMGIAVVEPNIRGSSGYGHQFEALDNGMKREDSIRDIGALLDWIETQPRLDSNRVVIVGGSYGGYVSLASLTHYSDRLRGGIARVGISDFKTFLESTERNRVNNRRREYGDERDPEMAAFFARISPLANADKITAPLLIVQGANDPRVPAAQAAYIRDAVRANGGPVWYLLSTRDGHSLRSDEARYLSSGAQALFLKRYLLDE